jgi:2-dehydropantoate 2-reductase
MAGVTTAARASMVDLLRHAEARDTILAALKEVEAVARARGVDLDADVVEKTMVYIETSARDLRASMHTDLELGRPLELEALNGAVVRTGKEVGVPTPVHATLYSLLLPYRDGHPPKEELA